MFDWSVAHQLYYKVIISGILWSLLSALETLLRQGFLTRGIQTPWEYGNQMMGFQLCIIKQNR